MSLTRFLNMPLDDIKRSNPKELVAKFEGSIRERNITISEQKNNVEYNWTPPILIGLTLGVGLWLVLSKRN